MSYHQTIILGNVGKIGELRYMQSGDAVINLSVAVNEAWNNANGQRQEKTTWYNVSAWRNLAEIVHQYVKVGDQLMVMGTVEARGYTTKSGEVGASLELRARDIRFVSGKREASEQQRQSENIPF